MWFVDIDGCVADLHTSLIQKMNAKYGTHFTVEDINTWDAILSEGGKRYPIDNEIREVFNDSKFILSLPLIKGSLEVIKHIAKTERVVFVTSRSHKGVAWTVEWLRKQGFGYLSNFVVHRMVGNLFKSNQDVCVDDFEGNIYGFGNVLFLDRPWNRDILLPSSAIRVASWEQIQLWFDAHQKSVTARMGALDCRVFRGLNPHV